MSNLDGRSRNEDGQIRRKRRDTLASTLADDHPQFAGLPSGTTLGDLEDKYGADSLDQVLRAMKRR